MKLNHLIIALLLASALFGGFLIYQLYFPYRISTLSRDSSGSISLNNRLGFNQFLRDYKFFERFDLEDFSLKDKPQKPLKSIQIILTKDYLYPVKGYPDEDLSHSIMLEDNQNGNLIVWVQSTNKDEFGGSQVETLLARSIYKHRPENKEEINSILSPYIKNGHFVKLNKK